jgi:hypothetical protein
MKTLRDSSENGPSTQEDSLTLALILTPLQIDIEEFMFV